MKTFCITIPGNAAKWRVTAAHLAERGLSFTPFYGFDYKVTGLDTKHPYEVDNPGSGYLMGPKIVGNYLSHYVLWRVLHHLEDPGPFLILEDDVIFAEDWRERFDAALAETPKDANLLYVGSCNAENKPRRAVGRHVYEVRYPHCTHAYVVWKKMLPLLLERLQKVWAPIDLALILEVFPKMSGVYTILPRLAVQRDTIIEP